MYYSECTNTTEIKDGPNDNKIDAIKSAKIFSCYNMAKDGSAKHIGDFKITAYETTDSFRVSVYEEALKWELVLNEFTSTTIVAVLQMHPWITSDMLTEIARLFAERQQLDDSYKLNTDSYAGYTFAAKPGISKSMFESMGLKMPNYEKRDCPHTCDFKHTLACNNACIYYANMFLEKRSNNIRHAETCVFGHECQFAGCENCTDDCHCFKKQDSVQDQKVDHESTVDETTRTSQRHRAKCLSNDGVDIQFIKHTDNSWSLVAVMYPARSDATALDSFVGSEKCLGCAFKDICPLSITRL